MSYWKKAPFGNSASLRDSWPIDQETFDPWAGDELHSLPCDSDYIQSLEDIQKQRQFLAKALKDSMKILPFHDRSIIHKAQSVMSDTQLAAIAEDWVPDIGLFAEERVLGPFAPRHKLRTLCGAILSFSPLLRHNCTPIGQYGSLKSRTKGSHSLGIQAKTPVVPWKIHDNDSVSPLLPIEERYIPNMPLQSLPQTPFMIARIVASSTGYTLSCVLPLPAVSPQYLFNRMRLEWIRLQYQNRYIYWEDMLRFRAELLYRSSLEYCFVHHKKETEQCLDTFF